ncbi:hypothetical protein GQ53DRAFT_384070 [Thozetella sp. PMI_491]|nr:hypothetical protein GQ53DRAFT_384070 [Thozetella sp. PMI_491]
MQKHGAPRRRTRRVGVCADGRRWTRVGKGGEHCSRPSTSQVRANERMRKSGMKELYWRRPLYLLRRPRGRHAIWAVNEASALRSLFLSVSPSFLLPSAWFVTASPPASTVSFDCSVLVTPSGSWLLLCCFSSYFFFI